MWVFVDVIYLCIFVVTLIGVSVLGGLGLILGVCGFCWFAVFALGLCWFS